jgi:SAM-dependent methyltransferase
MTQSTCFSCGSEDLRSFYEAGNIPVHSCLMMESRAEAVGYPTRDLELGFCGTCGFVQNNAFDPSVHEYSKRYEETQAFSPRFLDFQDKLVTKLLDDWDLGGKSVLEIGCGKGEFLVRMCELGAGAGIGIDPGYRPERTKSPAAQRIEFINDFYSRSYGHLSADFVCCRHTLEHIQNTREFMSMTRDAIGDRLDTVVFFEVPDVRRALEEQAFWDIYYEHCSYFSLGSLARLFRRCRFDVLDLWTDFDDQYLMIVAKPGDGTGGKTFASEDDIDAMESAVLTYEAALPQKRDHWHGRLHEVTATGGKVVAWGSGSKCVAWLTTLGIGDQLEYVVDINPNKHGKWLAGTGHEIIAPERLTAYQPDLVVVMNPIYVDEIRADCERLGVTAAIEAV